MPKKILKKSIKKVLLLGSGGLKIGQAGEFDYSGSQAIKALKEDGISVILVNPNIATVQTDADMADTVYFLPLTSYFVSRIIKKERPDGVLLGFGGQTALNLGLELEGAGVFSRYNVRVLGTPIKTIRETEDRGLFIKKLNEIGVKTARSTMAHTVPEAMAAAKKLGYPVMVRAGFALGGENSGMAPDAEALREKLEGIFRKTPQVLVEEYLGGWKEVEYEIVRDIHDNCIAVCNMENLDPMGVHTGESIVVAPSQTLNNHEYHLLREISLRTVRHLGVVGECNIQFALHPKSDAYRVIEVNARLSRSSALASKATGYPLAFVAAKLALGYALTDLKNSVTKVTQAAFEPALDYLVLKIPRWDLHKFHMAQRVIGSEMKSVGEVMAIGRSFEEALQKALRMLAIGARGLVAQRLKSFDVKDYMEEIRQPTDRRIFAIAKAFKRGARVKTLHRLSGIDPWFLEKIRNIVAMERKIRGSKLTPELLRRAKKMGFSDAQIAILKNQKEDDIRAMRQAHRIRPVMKQIDTLAGEFPAKTNYLYATYHGHTHDVQRETKAVMVLGSGPYSIGSSVEFDWCSVQAVKTLKSLGWRPIMVNYNPETVSTDYDMASRLYFDELSLERVLDLYEFEKPAGVILSMGGQIPNNIALKLLQRGARVLGTSPEDIDQAEDRHKFSALLDELKIDQPAWTEVTTLEDAKHAARQFGYPVLIRPSYVLSGSAMNVALTEKTLEKHLQAAADISQEHPVVISKFIENAREIEVDGVAKKGDIVAYALMEHVENAGTHSGDATVVIPPQRTYMETARQARHIADIIAEALRITGPFNIQFVAKDNNLMVIECNLRASRSFPFVSKALKKNFIAVATRAIMGKSVANNHTPAVNYVAVKSPQFSYNRIREADPLGYVEMASTGEVACFGDTYDEALLKSMLAANFRIPKKRVFVSIGREENKLKLLPKLKKLAAMRFELFATEHTADFLAASGVPARKVFKIHTGKSPNVADLLSDGMLDLVINIPKNHLSREIEDGYVIRRLAVDLNIPLISNLQIADAFIDALESTVMSDLKIKSWDEYGDR